MSLLTSWNLSPWAVALLAWILTYLLHSTVLWGAAMLATRAIKKPANEELLWRAVLLAGLLTASLQPLTGVEKWSLAPLSESQTSAEVQAAGTILDAPVHDVPMAAIPAAATTPQGRFGITPADPAMQSAGEPAWSERGIGGLPIGVVAAVLGFLMTAYFWLRPFVAWRRFDRHLGDRRELEEEGPVRQLLEELQEQSGCRQSVLLSYSSRISVPFAFGLRRPEICLPQKALDGLNRAEMRSLLAHELAHIVRRDPQWRFFIACLEDMLFFQPLNRLMGRRLGELAEFMSDDWSRRHTSPRSLAQCLVRVAEWLPSSPTRLIMASPMSAGRSQVSRRVTRLAASDPSSGISRARLPLALCLLLVALPVLAGVPGFGTHPVVEAPEIPLAPDGPSAPEAPVLPELSEKPEAPDIREVPEPSPAPEVPAAPTVDVAPEPPPSPPTPRRAAGTEMPLAIPSPNVESPKVPSVTVAPDPEALPEAEMPADVIPGDLQPEPELDMPPASEMPVAPEATLVGASRASAPAAPVEWRADLRPESSRSLASLRMVAAPVPMISLETHPLETLDPKAPLTVSETRKKSDISATSIAQESCDNSPRAIRLDQPVFPSRGHRMVKDETVVKANLMIDESGNIASASIEDGMPILGFGKAVGKVLKSAKFETCLKDGAATAFEHELEFRFSRSRFEGTEARNFKTLVLGRYITPEWRADGRKN